MQQSHTPNLTTHPRPCSQVLCHLTFICHPSTSSLLGFRLLLSTLCTWIHILTHSGTPVCLAAYWELELWGKKGHKTPVSPNKKECIQPHEGADVRGLPAGEGRGLTKAFSEEPGLDASAAFGQTAWEA